MLYSLLIGFGMFLLAFILHINMRKTIYSKSEIFSVLLSFILISIVFFLLLLLLELKLVQFLFEFKLINFEDVIFSYLLYVVLFGVYAITYPSISTGIPIFQILKLLKSRGPLRKQEIILLLEKKTINSKVERLQLNEFISIKDDYFKLNGTGVVLIRFFILYRKILGLNIGIG